MNNDVILEIIDGIEDTKTCMENELMRRKDESKEEEVERLGIEVEGIEGLEVKIEMVKLPIYKELPMYLKDKIVTRENLLLQISSLLLVGLNGNSRKTHES